WPARPPRGTTINILNRGSLCLYFQVPIQIAAHRRLLATKVGGRFTHLGHACPAPPVPPPLRRLRHPLVRRRSSWGCLRGNRSGSGRKAAGITGTKALGATRRPWLVPSIVPRPVRPVLPLPARARRDPAGPERAARLLPRGLAMQVRQQALRA
ncbi:unnamed protein product, partial [Musa hybrid cultivar]